MQVLNLRIIDGSEGTNLTRARILQRGLVAYPVGFSTIERTRATSQLES